jgi:hypothetical protein
MRKSNEYTLADALKDMIKEYRLGTQLNETRVREIWGNRMGKAISTYTSDVALRKNVLYISLLSASLKQELSYEREKIRKMMNEELGEEYIKEVVIR